MFQSDTLLKFKWFLLGVFNENCRNSLQSFWVINAAMLDSKLWAFGGILLLALQKLWSDISLESDPNL